MNALSASSEPPMPSSFVAANGNSAMPATCRRAGGSASRSVTQEARKVTVPPTSRLAAFAIAASTTTSFDPRASWPRSTVHGGLIGAPRFDRPLTPSNVAAIGGPPSRSIRAFAILTISVALTDGTAAMRAAVSEASGTRPPRPGISRTLTRMSHPDRSSRSRIDTMSPCDSSSMSRRSAPTAATPSTPRIARAGWRTRLRDANPTAFIVVRAADHCGVIAPTRPALSLTRRAERRLRSR